MSEQLPEKRKRGRPPIPRLPPPTKAEMSEVARFWLGLQTMRTNPITKQQQLLSQLDLITLKMIDKAKKGNVNAYNALMDRALGKPKQETEVTNIQNITIKAFSWAEIPSGQTPPSIQIDRPKPEEATYDTDTDEPVSWPDEEKEQP